MEDREEGGGSQEVEEGAGGAASPRVQAWGAWSLHSGVWTHQVSRWCQVTPDPGGGGAR